eukprot:CAMPEP_0171297128 /NCGR_PEP_ID=MMETSP0816-20121228/5891_1 /TAXON_ID=420281 /ORGANISM="Proboscia inermis, Strain CCAP1064/1" /LENGTH=43 /DNA_ID= /DNA_START= /DNA_END= /DNA_ORIENTATION=
MRRFLGYDGYFGCDRWGAGEAPFNDGSDWTDSEFGCDGADPFL